MVVASPIHGLLVVLVRFQKALLYFVQILLSSPFVMLLKRLPLVAVGFDERVGFICQSEREIVHANGKIMFDLLNALA